MIWQPPDSLVFLGQAQIDNLFQLSFCPAWHHSIHPSVISHPRPGALFCPLLPSAALPFIRALHQRAAAPERPSSCPAAGSSGQAVAHNAPRCRIRRTGQRRSCGTIKSSALNRLMGIKTNAATMVASVPRQLDPGCCQRGVMPLGRDAANREDLRFLVTYYQEDTSAEVFAMCLFYWVC